MITQKPSEGCDWQLSVLTISYKFRRIWRHFYFAKRIFWAKVSFLYMLKEGLIFSFQQGDVTLTSPSVTFPRPKKNGPYLMLGRGLRHSGCFMLKEGCLSVWAAVGICLRVKLRVPSRMRIEERNLFILFCIQASLTLNIHKIFIIFQKHFRKEHLQWLFYVSRGKAHLLVPDSALGIFLIRQKWITAGTEKSWGL